MTNVETVRLIVGLGNPGTEHEQTRHNAGFWFIDAVLRAYAPSISLSEESKFHGLTARISLAGKDVRLLTPNTYMNLSGQSVAGLANFYKIDPAEILVAHDELDIAPGTVRLKSGGGPGGHNGLKDVISSLGNQKQFGRLRIGIGHPGNARQVSNYVLKKAQPKEQQLIEKSIDEAVKYLDDIVLGNWQKVMNQLHSFDAATNQ